MLRKEEERLGAINEFYWKLKEEVRPKSVNHIDFLTATLKNHKNDRYYCLKPYYEIVSDMDSAARGWFLFKLLEADLFDIAFSLPFTRHDFIRNWSDTISFVVKIHNLAKRNPEAFKKLLTYFNKVEREIIIELGKDSSSDWSKEFPFVYSDYPNLELTPELKAIKKEIKLLQDKAEGVTYYKNKKTGELEKAYWDCKNQRWYKLETTSEHIDIDFNF